MEATISALLKNISDNMEPLKALNKPYLFSPEFWTLTAALSSSIIALLVAGGIGKFIKPLIGIKPELELITLRRYRQANQYWRLAIKNSGHEVAKRVQIDVTKIIDDGVERENFLSIPLRWTHINKESRDILPEQTVYIDVIEHSTSTGGHKAKLITNSGGGVDDFEVLKNGKTKIVLTVYQEAGKAFSKTLEMSWPAGLFLDTKLEGKKWYLTKRGSFV